MIKHAFKQSCDYRIESFANHSRRLVYFKELIICE